MNQRKTKRIVLILALLAVIVLAAVLICCGVKANSKTNYVPAEADISVTSSVPVEADISVSSPAPAEADISFRADTVPQETFGKYTHNYLQFTVDEIEYEGYCIAGDEENGGLFSLYTPENAAETEIFGGSLCNVSLISGIRTISVTYQSDSDIELAYGNDRNSLAGTVMLPAQQEYAEQTVTLPESVSFFRLTDTLGEVHVAQLELFCEGTSPDETAQYTIEGIRYVPETDYDPYEGETLELPVIVQDNAGNYYASAWKSYTYHSWEYCRDRIVNEGEDPAAYVLTDPEDVANYFVLFNRIPANYGVKEGNEENWAQTGVQQDVPASSEVLEVFGSDLARCVQVFTRTDGYCESIDYTEYEDTGLPLYYEFDFDVDGTYAFNNRGVGRVVGYVGGFACYDDGINAAVLTTDHYYTFAESTNCGFYNPHFDANSRCKTGFTFKASEIVTEEDFALEMAA